MLRRVKFERIRRNWSQTDLGSRAGIDTTTIGLIESGRLQPSQGQLNKLSRVFPDVPIDALLRPVMAVTDEPEPSTAAEATR
jgi:transcriptional regulator with XRE-family HTH domain